MSQQKLQTLIEMARQVLVSPEEREAQRVSFAFGNTGFENADITREDVIRASKDMQDARHGTQQAEPTERAGC